MSLLGTLWYYYFGTAAPTPTATFRVLRVRQERFAVAGVVRPAFAIADP